MRPRCDQPACSGAVTAYLCLEALAPADQPEALAAAVDAVMYYDRRTLARNRRRLLERYRYIHATRKVVGVGRSAWIGSGFSHHSVPSLSKAATRSAVGRKSEPLQW